MSEGPGRHAVLLDTCALIWLAGGDALAKAATVRLMAAGIARGILVSPVSAWEVGLLARPRPDGKELQFRPDPKSWFAAVMTGPGVGAAPLTPDIAIDASHLPGNLHADPADRLLIATARHLRVPIVTRDRRIIDYAAQGHVEAVPC